MNIYDTANQLAQEIKQSEEYVNYKMAKKTLNMKPELKQKIQEFEEKLEKYKVKQVTEKPIVKAKEVKRRRPELSYDKILQKIDKVEKLLVDLKSNLDKEEFYLDYNKLNELNNDIEKNEKLLDSLIYDLSYYE